MSHCQRVKGLRVLFMTAAVACLASPASAQSRNTENTLKLDDPAKRPPATIDAVAWMVGSWVGEAFGGDVEEVWTPPSAGTMVGMFKLAHDGKPSMYEFQIVVQEEGSLTLKLKHYHADFRGWEEKDEHVSFPLVKLGEDVAYFSGLTYRLVAPDQLEVHVALDQDDKTQEERLLFRRAEGG